MATADYPRNAVSHPPDPMADAGTILRRSLDRLASRRNARQVWNALARSLAWGAGLAALLMLAHRLYIVDAEWWAPVAIVAASLVIGWRNGTLRRAGAFDAALDADRALGLQERLSSAIAFAQPDLVRQTRSLQTMQTPLSRVRSMLFPRADYYTASAATPTQLVPALVQDAAARANGLDPTGLSAACGSHHENHGGGVAGAGGVLADAQPELDALGRRARPGPDTQP